MGPRGNLQLARIFGIRIGVSVSWFVVLFFLIYWLSQVYFHELVAGSQTTDYIVAVAGALGYFASLVLHELGTRAGGPPRRHTHPRHKPVVLRRPSRRWAASRTPPPRS